MLKNKIIAFVIPLFIGSTNSIAYGNYGTAPAILVALVVSVVSGK